MSDHRHLWASWADHLRHWGLDGLLATCLEAMGPFRWLMAQALYGSLPLFTSNPSSERWLALISLFEDEKAGCEFINLLRECRS